MKNNVLLSIVIPVYNRADSIMKLLSTILLQEDKECELIVVDDGSTDNSYNICSNVSEKFSMPVKVLTKKNGGASSARNEGIKEAEGKYICFVDSDDMIADSYVASIKKLCNKDFDIYEFDYKCGDSTRGYIDGKTDLPYGEISLLEYYKHIFSQRSNMPWNKVYRTEIIKENNIFFDTSLVVAEDICFTLAFLESCKSCFISDDSLYYYFLNPEGLCGCGNLVYLENNNELFLRMKKLINVKKLSSEYYQIAVNSTVNAFFRNVGELADRGYKAGNIMETVKACNSYAEVIKNGKTGVRKMLLKTGQVNLISTSLRLRRKIKQFASRMKGN